jgi:1-acyl-sn-glycerol-3-phosphate acyltransferase
VNFSTLRTAILGTYSYAEFTAFLVGILPMLAVSNLRHRSDSTHRYPGRWVRRLGRWSSKCTPIWKFRVEGDQPNDIVSKPYIVVANHESTADPFLLAHLPWDMRWVAKEELFRPPLTGWVMRMGGDIPVRRGDGESVREMMAECKQTLASGMSLMIFPEGTRSQEGDLLPFKEGAFRLSLETGVPILPIALAGTRNCRPKGSKWFGEARAIARVLPAIDPAGFVGQSPAALADYTRKQVGSAVQELRARLGFVSQASVAGDSIPPPKAPSEGSTESDREGVTRTAKRVVVQATA